ncbi:MAG: choice-of-anchor M domain-containing protein [Rothia sp. (in: high G+C Gram-positive bacteria)]|uniref:choice-of-anchor M domain-containing protein n=1 Tax=Rothia sp. (in: high G+C Gram-positive bacteria) TaxID=1885016 RepID=UPI0026DEB291|nr:choice-of-anchor M domain-containing protein [Rothia sp. (in: high G+C Gram-positive bacteria)]MDO5750451.1 choice-of-anchor M domain-containing protein [Rothia sp. (in: high G+C Gram-positive bacteria)]
MHTPTRTQRRVSGTLSALAALSLLAAGGLAPIFPATAGPDDGRIVTSKGHVDAPKVYWSNGTFTLKNEANPYKTGVQEFDLNTTVNWVGKGWDGRDGSPQYIFQPAGKPSLAFLGSNATLYMAPGLTRGNHDPIWAGLGADSNIPVELFRDGVFVTDILSVEGPGRMELFRHSSEIDPLATHRMLSSTDIGLHSWLLTQGAHTHNITTFSRPGRYVVTYRAIARAQDGTLIQSEPQQLSWQVGGASPISGEGTPNAVPTQDRYNAAPVGNLDAAGYTLSIAPHAGRENAGDEHLSDIDFRAANTELRGTLTLFNNGYFLTDLPVNNGNAHWEELMGSEHSVITAVFTPESGASSDSEAARWISNPLSFEPGIGASVSSAEGNGSWPEKILEPANTALPTGEYTLSSADYSVQVSEEPGYSGEEKVRRVTIRFADPNFRGFIRGGFYEKDEQTYPSLELESTVVNGEASFSFEDDDWLQKLRLEVKVLPHPEMKASASSLVVAPEYAAGMDYRVSGALKVDALASATPSPSQPVPSEPVPSTPAPGDSSAPVNPVPSASATSPVPTSPAPTPARCEAPPVLTHGHFDLQAKLENNQLSIGLKDDSGIIDPHSTVRPVDSVILGVDERARRTRTSRMAEPELDFIGPVGTAFYGLPQTQANGLPWPGYSTELIDYSQLRGGVKLHVEPVSMPAGARFGLFSQSLTGVSMLLDSTQSKSVIDADYATHAHANWVFTEPGDYELRVYYTATLVNGTEVRTEQKSLRFAVGADALAARQKACDTSASPSDSSSAALPGVRRVGDSSLAAGASAPGAKQSEPASSSSDSAAVANKPAQKSDTGTHSGVSSQGSSGTGSSGATKAQSGALAATGFSPLGTVAAGTVILAIGSALVIYRRRGRSL